MLENYQEKVHVTLVDLKCFIMMLDAKEGQELALCMSQKQFQRLLFSRQDHYVKLALRYLKQASDFDELEESLIMINHLFGHIPAIKQEKRELQARLLKINDAQNKYQILRHLTSLKTSELIDLLYQKHQITMAQAAFFCLIEHHLTQAHDYLAAMSERPTDALLDLYAAYSKRGYLRLERDRRKKLRQRAVLTMRYS